MADPVTDLTSVTGAYPLDIDGDHLVDLVVLRRGENMVLRGLGDCRFERANQALGIAGGEAWTVGFSATWESPTATLPTLAFGDYVTLDERESAVGCPDNQLIRPTDSGTVYAAPVALAPGWCTLSLLFSDWDRSGRRDLRVSNDRHYYRDGEEQLWRIEPGQPPREYGRDDGWARLQVWGMGIASQDLTGDGYPEVYLTSQGDNKLQTLADGPARPIFEDIALRRGATAHRPFAGGDVAAVDRVARRVRRRQCRRLHGPVRRQGQRRGADGVRGEGPEQPPARPARWHVRRRGGGGRAPRLRPGSRRDADRSRPRRDARSRRS